MPQRGGTRRQRARTLARISAAQIDPFESRVIRPSWRIRKETRSLYDLDVAEGDFDRTAWADLVRGFLAIEEETLGKKRGTKTAVAEKVGVSVRAVDTWLAQEVDAKEATVRAAAKAYKRNEMELLIKVGLYSIDSLLAASTAAMPDDELDLVLEAPISDVRKQQLVAQVLANQEQDKQRRLDQLQFVIAQIEQAESNERTA